jgi:Tfp pilus assembly protein PilV
MRGITLIELLASVLIVSVMVLGIFSVGYTLQSMNKTMSARQRLFLNTKSIATGIMADAMAAAGTSRDIGICLNNTETNTNYMCFRDAMLADRYPGSSLVKPKWNCYTRLNNAAGQRVNVYRCVRSVVDDTQLTGGTANACNNTGAVSQNIAACTAGGQFVGTLASDIFIANGYPAFSGNVFTMMVVNRESPGAAVAGNNSEVRIPLSVTPDGHSL